MQRANCLVSIGGDHGNTVPKWLCTAAEIAVLREIHGDDAVNEIEPVDEIKRSNREERGRLLAIYGAAKYPDQKPIVESMFPGVAARVFETIGELELDESFFKATGRLKARPAAEPVAVEEPAEDAPAFDEVQSADEVDEEEGVGEDMDDEHAEDVAPTPKAAPVRQPRKQPAPVKKTKKNSILD
jgi:hypothetical protein